MFISTSIDSTLYPFSKLYIGNNIDEVVYLGYPLNLTKKEYLILLALVENYPKTLNSNDLIDLIDKSMSSHNVSYHISSINKKAKIIGNRKLIKNKSKIGYFLNEEM